MKEGKVPSFRALFKLLALTQTNMTKQPVSD